MNAINGQAHLSRWDRKILLLELNLLNKEERHLERKQGERGLTTWERQRRQEVKSEKFDLRKRLGIQPV